MSWCYFINMVTKIALYEVECYYGTCSVSGSKSNIDTFFCQNVPNLWGILVIWTSLFLSKLVHMTNMTIYGSYVQTCSYGHMTIYVCICIYTWVYQTYEQNQWINDKMCANCGVFFLRENSLQKWTNQQLHLLFP